MRDGRLFGLRAKVRADAGLGRDRFDDSEGLRECGDCGIRKPLGDFYKHSGEETPRRICKPCNLKQIAEYRKDPRVLGLKRASARRYYQSKKGKTYQHQRWRIKSPDWRARQSANNTRRACELRDRVILKYGSLCACCGENIRPFLSLDHVRNDGKIERKTRNQQMLYRILDRLGIQSDYQVLCFNCNMGKHLNGGICPHDDILGLRLVVNKR